MTQGGETIFALASGAYHAGVAVVRVSGAQSHDSFRMLSGRKKIEPRRAVLSRLSQGGRTLDHALVICFTAPHSFTGEDVVEYHLHGGRAVIDGVLRALASFENHRPAMPGEFTRRAFENGKMDLTAAEAVADLIAAETEAQKLQALDQLGGALEKLYRGWTDDLAKILAHQEADIEFPEEDMPAGVADALVPQIKALVADIAAHLDDNRRGERLRAGISVAIIGAPNAGKSSLLNALLQRDVAIVSDQAGTTRDVIEAHLDLGGYPVILADTAGLRETDHAIEAEGIRRATDRAARADIKVAVFDGTQEPDAATRALVDDNTIIVYTKKDLAAARKYDDGFAVSSTTGAGLPDFLAALTEKVTAEFKTAKTVMPTRERHRAALTEALHHLQQSQDADLPELAAEDLRRALTALGRITGRVHVEDLLDRIFRDFCIGK